MKPDNIILKDDDLTLPYVIDFGISFNFNDNDDDNLTPDGQQLGNRFLILPEQKVGEIAKRDYRTDTCCLVGLLFFVLTGEVPTIILDEQNRKPHQRESAKEKLQALPRHKLTQVNKIFDIGFNQEIDRRWQTVASLIEQLTLLIEVKEESMKEDEDLVGRIKAAQEAEGYKSLKSAKVLLGAVNDSAKQVLLEVRNQLGTDWGWTQSGGILPNGTEYKNKFYPSNSINKDLNPNTTIHAFITGNEIVIRLIEGAIESEVFRQPMSEPDWNEFKDKLRNHYLSEIANKTE